MRLFQKYINKRLVNFQASHSYLTQGLYFEVYTNKI